MPILARSTRILPVSACGIIIIIVIIKNVKLTSSCVINTLSPHGKQSMDCHWSITTNFVLSICSILGHYSQSSIRSIIFEFKSTHRVVPGHYPQFIRLLCLLEFYPNLKTLVCVHTRFGSPTNLFV